MHIVKGYRHCIKETRTREKGVIEPKVQGALVPIETYITRVKSRDDTKNRANRAYICLEDEQAHTSDFNGGIQLRREGIKAQVGTWYAATFFGMWLLNGNPIRVRRRFLILVDNYIDSLKRREIKQFPRSSSNLPRLSLPLSQEHSIHCYLMHRNRIWWWPFEVWGSNVVSVAQLTKWMWISTGYWIRINLCMIALFFIGITRVVDVSLQALELIDGDIATLIRRDRSDNVNDDAVRREKDEKRMKD